MGALRRQSYLCLVGLVILALDPAKLLQYP